MNSLQDYYQNYAEISMEFLVFYKVLIRGYFLVLHAILVTCVEERWVQKKTGAMVRELWVYLICLAWQMKIKKQYDYIL